MRTFLTRPGDEFELVEDWISTPALRDLVEMDGGTWPEGTLVDKLVYLEEFSSRWDKRHGDLRLVFHNDDESRTTERAQLVYRSARALGLIDPPAPSCSEPDFVLILGGLATGAEPRVRYVAELVESRALACRHIVGLGSYRPIDERERTAADRFSPNANSELDLLAAIMSDTFDVHAAWSATVEGDPKAEPRLAQTRMDTGRAPRLTVLAARSSAPHERPANTADTYLQFADELLKAESAGVLVVTSSIYVAYQHMDAVRTLGLRRRIAIESVGVPNRSPAPSHPPSGYLQEIRSAIRSARALTSQLR